MSDGASAALTVLKIWGGSGTGDGQFQQPSDIAVDPAGNVYVADLNNSRIQVFTPDGTFVRKWGSFGSNAGQLGTPRGVALDAAGDVYVADSGNYRIEKFHPDGTLVGQVGATFAANPRGIAIGPNGHLYVTESTQVTEMDPSGAIVRTWGTEGTNQGQFTNARGITTDPAGTVYVADQSGVVQSFSATGAFIRSYGQRAAGPGQLGGPYDVAIAPDGHVLVADQLEGIIDFTADGQEAARDPDAAGESFRPNGLAFGAGGDLYVSDNQANTGNRMLRLHRDLGPPPLPPPVAGQTVNAGPDRGTVLVKLPAGATLRTAGSPVVAAGNGFVKLTGPAQLPVGTQVDTLKGQVSLTTSAGRSGGTFTGSFYGGQFALTQQASGAAITQLALSQQLTCTASRRTPRPGACVRGICGATPTAASVRAGATARRRCAGRSGS